MSLRDTRNVILQERASRPPHFALRTDLRVCDFDERFFGVGGDGERKVRRKRERERAERTSNNPIPPPPPPLVSRVSAGTESGAYTEVSVLFALPMRRESEGDCVVVSVTVGGIAIGARPILELREVEVVKVRVEAGAAASARRRGVVSMVGGGGVRDAVWRGFEVGIWW